MLTCIIPSPALWFLSDAFQERNCFLFLFALQIWNIAMVSCSQWFLKYLAFKSFDLGCLWWRLFKKHVALRKTRYLSFYFSFTLMHFRKGISLYTMWNICIVLWYFLLSTTFILDGLLIFWSWMHLMKIIPETCRAREPRYLYFYFSFTLIHFANDVVAVYAKLKVHLN